MKFTIFATIFAALASSGYAATPEAPEMNAAPANNVQDETPETPTAETDADKRGLRGNAEEEVGAKASEGKPVAGKKRGLKNNYPSGQSCTLCCDDDTQC